MKKLISIIFMFMVSSSIAQELIKEKDGRLYIQEVIDLPGKTHDQIYKGIKLWISESFNDPKEVTKMDEYDLGIIQVNYITNYRMYLTIMGFYNTMKIEIKEFKIRITLENIRQAEYNQSLIAYVKTSSGEYRNTAKKTFADVEALYMAQKQSIIEHINNQETEDW